MIFKKLFLDLNDAYIYFPFNSYFIYLVNNMETKKRSIMKAISWRFIATIITSLLVLLLTGEGTFAATIGLADTSLKFFIYFAHERMWNRIRYGLEEKQPEYMI